MACFLDDNECLDEGSGNNCHADAICSNKAGSFDCACKIGYRGDGLICTGVILKYIFMYRYMIYKISHYAFQITMNVTMKEVGIIVMKMPFA